MHAAAKLAVGMARFAVTSILLALLLCIAGSKAQDTLNDLELYSGSGSGDVSDNEEGDSPISYVPTEHPLMEEWKINMDEEYYYDNSTRCTRLPYGMCAC